MQVRQSIFMLFLGICLWGWAAEPAWAQAGEQAADHAQLEIKELLQAGGWIGILILAMSVAMIALIFEHLLSIRRAALMPHGLAEEVHRLIGLKQYAQAEQQCKLQPSFLGYVLASGLAEIGLGYSTIEKAMEDASTEQSARLFRKIEYLSVISTLAPMLGLLGTVGGMITAFLEFETKANPQVSELAPGIYRALVTTFLGLSVAVPALAAFAIFRNRVDELVAESTLMAEHVFSKHKRSAATRRLRARRRVLKKIQPVDQPQPQPASDSLPSSTTAEPPT